MELELKNEPTAGAESRTQRAITIVRLVLAMLLTALGMPYAWARSFVGWQLVGQPEIYFAVIFLFAIAAIVGLTYRLGDAPAVKPRAGAIVVVMIGVWIAVNVAMFWAKLGTLVPRVYVLGAYLPGSLAIPWAAWMSFRPMNWQTRLIVSVPLVTMLAGFLLIFRAEGLSGDSSVNFAWRWAASKPTQPVESLPTPAVSESADAPLIEDPEHDSPQFLGPDRTGILPNSRLARDWSSQPPRELWRRSVGAGWSSFAIVGELAFTQEQRGERESVVCYRVKTGAEVWAHSDPVNFTSSLGGPGPRATPTVREGRVYAVGVTGILNCLDGRNGRRIWSVDILKDNHAENIAHGVCASPLVLEDVVLVCPTGSDGPSLVAYDRETGRRAWSGGTHGASYSSPLVAELCGTSQVLLFNSAGISGHELGSGKELWFFAWTNSATTNVAQPIVHAAGADRVFISTGYDTGCTLLQITASADESWHVEPLWSNNHLKTKFCSAVAIDGFVYGLDDGILACLNLTTGVRKWKAGRYGHGQVLLAGKLLLVQAESGDVILIDPSPMKLRELGRIPALTGKTWNNPALAGSYLLVRNDHEAACYELRCE